MTEVLRIGLIGHGAIGRAFVECLESAPHAARIVAVLTRTPRPALAPGLSVASLEGLLDARPGVVVECAGQEALRQHAPTLLRRGREVIAASVGALADESFARVLAEAGQAGGGRLLVAPGAVAGLDGLAAARLIGIDTVTYRQRAPATSWLGHPLAPSDLADRAEHTVFSGSAGEAARLFPKNANVTAAVALAGIGFEKTRVELVSDAGVARNRHEIRAEGAFGTLHVEVAAEPIAPGVRSSRLVAGSLLHAALRRASCVDV